MDTYNTFTIRFSQMVFNDFRRRGILSDLRQEGHEIIVVKETKRDVVITVGEKTVSEFICDIEWQLEVIVANGDDGDASMKYIFQRALNKFVEAKAGK